MSGTSTPRPMKAADLAQVQAIYAREVLEGTASFELDPPDAAELEAKPHAGLDAEPVRDAHRLERDRKSTRLNSSH